MALVYLPSFGLFLWLHLDFLIQIKQKKQKTTIETKTWSLIQTPIVSIIKGLFIKQIPCKNTSGRQKNTVLHPRFICIVSHHLSPMSLLRYTVLPCEFEDSGGSNSSSFRNGKYIIHGDHYRSPKESQGSIWSNDPEQKQVSLYDTNPNNALLLMAEILHQMRLVVYPIIYSVSYIPGGAGFLPSTVSQEKSLKITIDLSCLIPPVWII